MSSITSKYLDDKGLTIKIVGKFDFSQHQQFRNAYESVDAKIKSFIIDLSEASYMDSSAFGMLLVLRERYGGANADITLSGFNHSIGLILEVAKFGRLFKLKEARKN